MKFHVKKGDTVKVLAGNSRGKTGAVLEVFPAKYKAIVEGLNMVTKHTKPSAENPEGGIKKVEAPIHLSNLMLVDPASGEATKVARKAGDNGKLIRVSKKTGEVING
ncbi:50S ribosomal protein L24 [Reichenbachiella ulvae]|uniref:Large ribosomal subunit protein uL24 n=1 Tax=Reichenbachiella ulvae TaxID=2980104 RepID=A0ABT3CZM4_9BACT|nr:50S ribosomal protein L24 [Reichenbachiella ulvae]MCV9389003.1 50S ribosomal protein L24 [Reichenbachiella ulvae]